MIGFTEYPTDEAAAGELADAFAHIGREIKVFDYNGHGLAAVEVRQTETGVHVRLRFSRQVRWRRP